MKRSILFVDACPRKESRTRELGEYFVSRLSGEVNHLKLCSEHLLPLDENGVVARESSLSCEPNAHALSYARGFAAADEIVIAAPCWDFSFPSILKVYFEHVSVPGIAFRYVGDNEVKGLCRAKRLTYITTAGGPIFEDAFGFGYIKALCGLYGIRNTHYVKAENLDLAGADVPRILEDAKARIAREIPTD